MTSSAYYKPCVHFHREGPAIMGISTRQIPYIGATIVLFIGGILFFAFP